MGLSNTLPVSVPAHRCSTVGSRLETLTGPIGPSDKFLDRRARMDADGDDLGMTTMRMHKAAMRRLLMVRVLVQNRRKEKGAILVYSHKAQVVAHPSATATIQKGDAPLGEKQTKFTRERRVTSRISDRLFPHSLE